MLESVRFPHESDQSAMLSSGRFRQSQSGSLPLQLVGEEGWLIFTRSLKRWGGLRRTNRILKHKRGGVGGHDSIMSYRGHQNYSWEDTERTVWDSDFCFCASSDMLPTITAHTRLGPESFRQCTGQLANSRTHWRE